MYQLIKKTIDNRDLLILISDQGVEEARFCLNEGGRICHWSPMGETLIGEPVSQDYANSYAGALLLPFVNRIKGGAYVFGKGRYQLQRNEGDINAIHGLVYNKKFDVVDTDLKPRSVRIQLEYTYKGEESGFPFSFKTMVVYKIAPKKLSLELGIVNIGKRALPFNLGWHPYFYVAEPLKAEINFEASHAFDTDARGITTGVREDEGLRTFMLNEELDHAFRISSGTVQLRSPKRLMELSFPEGENYLQIYTPKNEPYVAIEPMTGISDSFNNKTGLQTLAPMEEAAVKWCLESSNDHN
jgi:aldose 1-epimerase